MIKNRFQFALKKIRGKSCKDCGQALVEFALALPILLILLGAVIDIGRIINYKIVLQSAASDSVKYIQKDFSDSQIDTIRTTIKSDLTNDYKNQLDVNNLDISCSRGSSQHKEYTYHLSEGNGVFGNEQSYYDYFDATVTLKYDVPMITPVMAQIVGKKVTLSSQFTGQVYENGYEKPKSG